MSAEVDQTIPLTAAQAGIWCAQRLDEGNPMYTFTEYVDIRGGIDVEVFEQALRVVVGESASLRCTVVESGTRPAYRINPAPSWTLGRVDLRGVGDAPAEAAQLVRTALGTPMDHSGPSLFEFSLLQLADDRFWWLQRYHHVVMDGAAMAMIESRVAEVYSSLAAGQQVPPCPFGELGDLLGDDEQYRDSDRFETDQVFWAQQLQGAPEPETLSRRSCDGPARAMLRSTVELDPTLVAQVRSLARESQVSWPVVFVAAWALYVGRATGTDDVVLALPSTARTSPRAKTVPGMASNVVPLRVDVNPEMSIAQMVRACSETMHAVLRHQSYRYEDLRRDRNVAGPGARLVGPHINIALHANPLEFAGAKGVAVNVSPGLMEDTSLAVDARRPDGSLALHVDANADLYDQRDVSAIPTQLVALITQMCHRAEGTVAGLSTATDRQRATIEECWNDTDTPRDDATLVDLLDAQAARTPQAIAVTGPDGELTYRQLSENSNRLARHLVSQGARPETLVAVSLPRGCQLLTGLLAVLKAGAAYLPLDPGYPAERRQLILHDAHPVLGLTTSELAAELTHGTHPEESPAIVWVALDEDTVTEQVHAHDPAPLTDSDRHGPLAAQNLAYVIFTSGSTGRPKGVQVTHSGVADLMQWAVSSFSEGRLAHVLAATSLNFDVSVFELFAPLCAGGRVEVVRDLLALAERPNGWQGTLMSAVPSALAHLLRGAGGVVQAQDVVVAGEALTSSAASVIRDATGARLSNIYGPTEATVYATASYRVTDTRNPAVIGSALPNTRTYVLDNALQPVPPGAVGELYLAGNGLARGYLEQPALTADRFVADPFDHPGERMYRTGDLVRWNRWGDIEFVGRVDDQVKIRGFRVELGEIEHALRSLPGVDDAVVIVRDGATGESQLLGYTVPAPGHTPDGTELRRELQLRLPAHLVPAAVIVLAQFPLNPNGKLDRAALPAPTFTTDTSQQALTEAEALLCRLFAEVLAAETFPADASFLDHGGDSILAIQVANRARQAGLVITPRQVLEVRTPARLAELAGAITAHVPDPVEETGPLPLSPIAQWLLQRPGPVDSVHQSVLLAAPAALTQPQLTTIWRRLIEHHAALRTSTGQLAETGHLHIGPRGHAEVEAMVSVVATDNLDEDARAELIEAETRLAWGRLSIEDDVLAQVVWFTRSDGKPGRLLIVAHHLLIDGMSWRIVMDDLIAAWADLDNTTALPPTTTSVRSWVTELARTDRSNELDTWLAQFQVTDPPFAGGAPVPPGTAATAGRMDQQLSEDLTRAAVVELPRLLNGTPQDVMLAALTVAVEQWRRDHHRPADGLLVTLEGLGRTSDRLPGADVGRTIGWLTSAYPVGVSLSGVDLPGVSAGDPTQLAALLRTVKQAIRTIPDSGLGYGQLRQHADPDSALAQMTPPQTALNYLGRIEVGSGQDWSLTQPPTRPLTSDDTHLGHTLELDITQTTVNGVPTLRAQWQWDGTALSGQDGFTIAGHWLTTMETLARFAASEPDIDPVPADFPLVEVNTDLLASIQARHGQVADLLPVSPTQAGLLFHALTDDDDVYTMQYQVVATGELEESRWRQAVADLAARHPHLGARFWAGSETLQVLPRVAALPVTFHHLAHLEEVPAAVGQVADAERRTSLDPTSDPLVRVAVVSDPAGEHHIIVTAHHIVIDGWSMPVLLRELVDLYDATPLPAPTPYSTYLTWLSRQDRAVSATAWSEAFTGVEEGTLISRAVTDQDPNERRSVTVELAGADLQQGARSAGVTLSTLIHAGWGLALSAVTGQSDTVFGATVSGRPAELPGVEQMVGLFITTIPTRFRSTPAGTVTDLLRTHQDEQLTLSEHHTLGLPAIQRAIGLERPFDTLVVVENYPIDPAALTSPGSSLTVRGISAADATHYPLTLVAIPGQADQPAQLRVDYRPELIPDALAATLAARLQAALTAFCDDPDTPTAELELAPPEERAQLLTRWNQTTHPVRGTTLVAAFEAQADRTPDAPALIFQDRVLTYRELDEEANEVAHHLHSRGVRPGDRVAVAVPRSVELVVSLYGVLKTGAAYLPIETDYPADRIGYILEAGHPTALILEESVTDRVPTPPGVPVVTAKTATCATSSDWAGAPRTRLQDTDRGRRIHPADIAYVIYTSGSTGRPKGVAVPHAGIINRLEWMQDTYQLTPDEKVLQKTPSGFDVSVWEFFWAHQIGATLVMARPDGHRDPDYLAELIENTAVTTVHFVPSMLAAFLQQVPADRATGLRRVLCSGEALPPDLARTFLSTRTAELHNLYGPTEASVDVTAWQCHRDDTTVPIGHPVWNTRMHVLDEALRPCPIGTPGDLYIAGIQLAQGYLDRPDLTGARFVADPHGAPGERMYATGDVARRRPDGALEYLGRSDHQVKIRGLRIELEEIEAVLSEKPGVARAVVRARGEGAAARLIAWVVPAGVDTASVREAAAATLPDYMVPAAVVALAELPLSPNGKLDAGALPDPGQQPSGSGSFTHENADRLAALFGEVLRRDHVGGDDNFFALGGDSIMSIQLVGRARQAGLEFTPRHVFDLATPNALAAVARPGTGIEAEPAEAAVGDLPPTPMAQWLLDTGPAGRGFTQSVVLATPPDQDEAGIAVAVQTLLDHHGALRVRVKQVAATPTMVIDPPGAVPVSTVLKVTPHPYISHGPAIESARRDHALRVDPQQGTSVLATWLPHPGGLHGRLLLTVHHLAVDGVSWNVIVQDLHRAVNGQPLSAQRVSYRTWCRRLHTEAARRTGELEQWLDQLPGPTESIGSRPLEAHDTVKDAGSLTIELDANQTRTLTTDLPLAYRCTVQEVLLTALGLAVADSLGHRAVSVEVEGHGREAIGELDASTTVGWFTTSYPVRLQVGTPDWLSVWAGGPEIGAYISAIKENLRTMPDGGAGYGLLRRLNPATAAVLAARPNPPIGFNYLGAVGGDGQVRSWEPAPESHSLGGSAGEHLPMPHPIEITAHLAAHPDGAHLSIAVAWASGVLEQDSINQFETSLNRALRACADHRADAATSQLTPSDITLVPMTQDDLADLEEDFLSDFASTDDNLWELPS